MSIGVLQDASKGIESRSGTRASRQTRRPADPYDGVSAPAVGYDRRAWRTGAQSVFAMRVDLADSALEAVQYVP
jgi:hypothetical protein